MSQRGKFIVLDGGEGSGTTSAVKFLHDLFPDKSIKTREPGGTPFAEEVRNLALFSSYAKAKELDAETQFALMWAARRNHVKKIIEPALESGKHVFSDRLDSSTYAYQVIAGRNRRLGNIFQTMRKLYLGECVPDFYVILDVSPEIGLARMEKRGDAKTCFDEEKLEFHKLVRGGFLVFAQSYFSHCATIIDASLPEKDVKNEILKAIENFGIVL